MILTIQIEVDEQKYKEAVARGWYDRFEEEIAVSCIQTVDNFDDFKHALPHMIIDDDAVQMSVFF